ncbi:MAG: hypothetical protein KF780_12350 [Sphingomonas sp.]|nr:hypothetical protein [Sphingomonas sp.]
MSSADRQKRYRARRRKGVAVVPVEIGDEVYAALALGRYVSDDDMACSSAVGAAIGRALCDWSNEKIRYALQIEAPRGNIVTSS